MTAVDLSSFAGLAAMCLLTVNVLLGILIASKYNPMRQWPHRWIPIFKIHNWNAYIAVTLVVLHPLILLFSKTAGFGVMDVLWPVRSPGQTLYNCLGAITFYAILFVVITSYFRPRLGNRRWKPLHYVAYAAAAFLFAHSILIDPNLKNQPPDLIDGEKVLLEGCLLLLLGAIMFIRVHSRLKSKQSQLR